ncbi:MAG TPA: prepilin-type N-terminal cleavage/methylation domain-containing protein [Candidatus Absconditabacterales bacterium]|nr:prepilin-type N-terminal cleavage/methylation domain-containing protein [Candidatus Absconditabacterales bacterium]HMT26910.1 prepilin-type N-terminal cleavage/methylation domain-containing protein [Candidatus Absconditabacterales bacterium]
MSSKYPKAFTMVELIVVIVILGIIALLSQSNFDLKNKERTLSQACATALYGEIRNFFDEIQNSKGVFLSGETFFPEEYSITISPDNQNISLGFTKNGVTNTFKTFSLSGKNLRNINYCTKSNYSLRLSGEDTQLILQKEFKNTILKPGFFISGTTNTITGEIKFEWCSPENESCKEIFLRQRDKRLNKINGSSCQGNGTGGQCFNRISQ